MTDLTRVTACKTKTEAAQTAGYWKGMGYHVAVAGPTDAIRLDNGEGVLEWESGAAADWYIVVASKASLEVLAAAT